MKKIVTLTTDGGDREDGNVYYAHNILVDSGGALTKLKFDEPIFLSGLPSGTKVDGGYAGAIQEIRSFGYTVEELEQIVVICESSDEDEEEDEEQ